MTEPNFNGNPTAIARQRPITVLVLGAVYDTGNMGVDALLSGTITALLNAAPDATVKALDYGVEPKSWTIPTSRSPTRLSLINLRFSYKLHLRNNVFRMLAVAVCHRCLPSEKVRSLLERSHPHLREIKSADLCVSLAGGDSFADIYGLRRLLYVCLPQILALTLKRPLVILPQTLGPFSSRVAKALGSFTMKKAKLVYSRDLDSIQHARAVIGTAADQIRFSRDMAFALESAEPKEGEPEWLKRGGRPLVGLNVSGLLHMGGYSKDNMFDLALDYTALVTATIRYFTLEAEANLVLITHVTGAPGGIESDATACSEFFQRLAPECNDRLHLASPSYDHREIKYLIGKCDFFLGARMHACIAALSQGVPAVGMAYSRKFKGVFESLSVPELVVDLRAESTETALERIKKLYTDRARFSNVLQTTAHQARSEANDIFLPILTACGALPDSVN